MSCTIVLRPAERQTLLYLYHHPGTPEVGRRAHILRLLAEGYAWDTIATVLFTSPSTIARWPQRFQEGGIEALAGQPSGRRPGLSWHWAGVVVRWVTERSPCDFGFLRSRSTAHVDTSSKNATSGARPLEVAGTG